jgi:hypothetical protein
VKATSIAGRLQPALLRLEQVIGGLPSDQQDAAVQIAAGVLDRLLAVLSAPTPVPPTPGTGSTASCPKCGKSITLS